MKILVTGTGSSGSWQIRGKQLGYAIGAKVKPRATLQDMVDADLVVVVKRLTPSLRAALKQSKRPWVWDLIDFYPQPACTFWGRAKACRWVRSQIQEAKPNAIVWPTARMLADCDVGRNSLVLPHHHWPDIEINPIREEVKTIGYEGNAKYLGAWGDAFRVACHQRGINFVTNIGTHSDWDICIAFRDDSVNGYAQKHWKSNVKLANAHGSGTPFIGAEECGYQETEAGGEIYISQLDAVGLAIDSLMSVEKRKEIHAQFRAKALNLETVGRTYRQFLNGL